jgi:hypothetical protein
MDLEKVRKHYKWDPYSGDYSKSYVSYERRMLRRKQLRNTLLIGLYAVLLAVAIILIYRYFD